MKKLLILLLFPLMIFAQDSTLTGDLNCDNIVDGQDAEILQGLIFQIQDVNELAEEYPCFNDNVTGLTPEQLQELVNMMDEQLSINYTGGGGSNYPIMISSISSEEMYLGEALIYCADLEEDGYSDWFLPNFDQLGYAISGGCEYPDERTDNYLWTRTKEQGVLSQYAMRITESTTSSVPFSYGDGDENCRCVRFGEGETSEGSNGSSNSSGSSILGNSEQAITMIGPMYREDEFTSFISSHGANGLHQLLYFDAFRFCSQLEYGGYDDWFIPSKYQIEKYLETNETPTIEILNYDNNLPTFRFYLKPYPTNKWNEIPQMQLVDQTISDDTGLLIGTIFGGGNTDLYGSYQCLCVR